MDEKRKAKVKVVHREEYRWFLDGFRRIWPMNLGDRRTWLFVVAFFAALWTVHSVRPKSEWLVSPNSGNITYVWRKGYFQGEERHTYEWRRFGKEGPGWYEIDGGGGKMPVDWDGR